MLFRNGRYVRINQSGALTNGQDGIITKFDHSHVTVKMLSDGRHYTFRRTSVQIHDLVLYHSKSSGIIGSMNDAKTHFYPNGTSAKLPISNAFDYEVFFFRPGQTVRFVYNCRGEEGTIAHVDPGKMLLTINFNNTLVTRAMKDVSLPPRPASENAKKFVQNLKERDARARSAVTEYELIIVKNSGPERSIFTFKTKELMKDYLDKLVNPANVKHIRYREVVKTFGTETPIKMKIVFEL